MVLLIVDASLKLTVATKYLWTTVHNGIKSHDFLRKDFSASQNVSFYNNSQFSKLYDNFGFKVVVLYFGLGFFCVCGGFWGFFQHSKSPAGMNVSFPLDGTGCQLATFISSISHLQ